MLGYSPNFCITNSFHFITHNYNALLNEAIHISFLHKT